MANGKLSGAQPALHAMTRAVAVIGCLLIVLATAGDARAQQDGAWSTWVSLGPQAGGATASSPALASWEPGRLDLFAVGADHALWQRTYRNAWSPWFALGGSFSLGPSALATARG